MSVHLALINRHIEAIGNELVGCDLNCDGITNHIKDPACSAPPRCLYFDWASVQVDKPEVIVVGINPGSMKSEEQKFMNRCRENGSLTYKDIVQAWQNSGKNRKYYKHGKQVIDRINELTSHAWSG